MYASLGRRLFEAQDTQAAVKFIAELKIKLRDRIPSIEEVRALFPSIIFTDNQTKQRNLMRYILARFQACSTTAVTIDFEGMTIEHLVPQSQIGSTGFPEEIIGQVGNLLLIPPSLNGKLANKTWKEKKKLLANANVTIPTEFQDNDEILVKDIKTRTGNLADTAYKNVWKI